MKIRLPLYAQIILVFVINLGLLLALRFLFVSNRMNVGWETLLYSPVAERVQAISFAMHRQMCMSSNASWNSILEEFGRFYGVEFYLFDMNGHQIAGAPVKLPSEVRNEVVRLGAGPIVKRQVAPVIQYFAAEPLTTLHVPHVAGSFVASSTTVMPSTATVMPSMATVMPSTATVMPSTTTFVPSANTVGSGSLKKRSQNNIFSVPSFQTAYVGRVMNIPATPGKLVPHSTEVVQHDDFTIHKRDWLMDVFDPSASVPPPMPPKVFLHTKSPDRYWIGAHIPIPHRPVTAPAPPAQLGLFHLKLPSGQDVPVRKAKTIPIKTVFFGSPGHLALGPGTLLASTPNLWTTRLMSDYKNVFLVAIGIFGFSMLIWWPFVLGITRALGKLTKATERIAQGQFDTTINVNRGDEIGRLAQAINTMSSRLNAHLTGQKRFLGDIAHELASPVARLQLALEILERNGREEQQSYIRDIREEVQQMSALINELLAFSKASVQGKDIELVPISLSGVIDGAIAHTCSEADVNVDVPDNFFCLGEEVLLKRAIGNVLRNAVRYAGDCGPITIQADLVSDEVRIVVRDCGPGIPAETIELIGQPFYRPEAARSRTSGGTGLGLAIVKTCIEACEGTFKVCNLRPRGFEVEMRLKSAGASMARGELSSDGRSSASQPECVVAESAS